MCFVSIFDTGYDESKKEVVREKGVFGAVIGGESD